MRTKSKVTLVNLRDELKRIQDSEEVFLNNEEFSEYIGMSHAWYNLIITKPKVSVFRRTIKTIAERLNKDFEINGDKIRFIDREEPEKTPDLPSDEKTQLFNKLKAEIEQVEDPEKRRLIMEALRLLVHYTPEQIEAVKVILGLRDQK